LFILAIALSLNTPTNLTVAGAKRGLVQGKTFGNFELFQIITKGRYHLKTTPETAPDAEFQGH